MHDPHAENRLGDTGIRALFAAIDRRDTDAFAAFLSPDVSFRFGNADAISGKQPVAALVQGFFDSIQGLRHELSAILRDGSAIVCRGEVTYTRHDGSRLSVPFANFFDTAGGLIRDYQIYVDVSLLYNAGAAE